MTSLRTKYSADVEAMRAELRKKGHDLMIAARYGKGLLEENSRYQKDMESAQQECDALKEALEAQKRESHKALSDTRQVAEQHVAELEQQLDSVKSALERERATTSATKEDFQRRLEQLEAENAQLKEELEKVAEEKKLTNNQLQNANSRLSESETQKEKLMKEISNLQLELSTLKENNTTLEESVGTLVHTCDQLSDKLDNSREEVDELEKRYKSEKEELMTTIKDLEDTQDQLKELQIQYDSMEQQNMHLSLMSPNASMASRMSLYDEIYSSHESCSFDNELLENSGHQDDIRSVCSESDVSPDKFGNDFSPMLPRRSQMMSPVISTSSLLSVPGWTSEKKCLRCGDLEKQLVESKQEVENVTKQLIIAVQQKFKLQEQVEAWQSDMAQMVEKQVTAKLKSSLHKAQRRASSKKSTRGQSSRTHKEEPESITCYLTKQPYIF